VIKISAIAVASLGDRKNTLMPELLAYFGPDALLEFCQRFAGTQFTVPPPEEIQALRRDLAVAAEIKASLTLGERLELMNRHRISHDRLADIYVARHGRALQSCGPSNRRAAVRECAVVMKERPNTEWAGIAAAYGLTAKEAKHARRQAGEA
jgi:hypothetical protein